MPHRPMLFLSAACARRPLWGVDIALGGGMLFLPNLFIGASFMHVAHTGGLTDGALATRIVGLFGALPPSTLLLWVSVNCVLAGVFIMLRRHLLHPLGGAVKQVHGMLDTLGQEAPKTSLRSIAHDVTRMATLAQEYYQKHQEASRSLAEARNVLVKISAQQQTILASTRREMTTQYQSVLAYANYLEEKIARHAGDAALRYDFDDVSESSFNLQLIAGALELIQHGAAPQAARLDVPMLMQQTLLALAPSLDRRAMKLTTAEVELEVMAQSDPAIVSHVLWMMLLGTIRYAADESTLRLRCLYNRERTRAILSIVVTELSPGRLSEDERGAFLASQLQHLTPHMFAETIRIHANMQLAEMLMAQLDGGLSIVPLTSHSCEICLTLPAPPTQSAKKVHSL